MKRRGFLKGIFGAAAAVAGAKVGTAIAALSRRPKWKVVYHGMSGATIMQKDTIVQIDVVED